MRKSSTRFGTSTTARQPTVVTLSDLNARSGRVTGVAFGAPGPRINLNKVLESWRSGDTVGGGSQSEQPAPARERTVALADGTMISFSDARAPQTAD